MFYDYIKRPIIEGRDIGLNHTIRIGAETEEELVSKKAMYFSDGWSQALKETYDALMADIGTAEIVDQTGETPELSQTAQEAVGEEIAPTSTVDTSETV